jgi:hypothetical protein
MPSHRPYANDSASPPSVTQVVGLMDKPGLVWGAARETAKFAVHHYDRWRELSAEQATDTIYRHHRGVWDHRALLGSALHYINAEWCAGHTVLVSRVVSDMREQSPIWQRLDEKEIYSQLLPMADGLADCWLKLRPETLSYEQVVRHRNGDAGLDYIGQTDWRALINGVPTLLELKTTGSVKRGSGKYWDAWRLQLAAYRFATEGVVYDEEDTERGTVELPEVDGAAVVHVYGDGRVDVNPVRAGKEEHDVFLGLRRAFGWRRGSGTGAGV